MGSRPNSDNVEMLHAVFLRPKTVLQYFVCIFSYDDFSYRPKVSQKVLFLIARSMALYKGRYSSIYHISQL